MKGWIISCMLLLSAAASGQQFTLRGQVTDAAGNPLPLVTVRLTDPSDTAFLRTATSDSEGAFELENLPRKRYLLNISSLGYQPYSIKITPPQTGNELDLETLSLAESVQQLEGVEVRAAQLPMRIIKDTVEFNAGSFGTRPNAVVEDLLKKLPGVEVDDDGTIRAQGETVERVLVDGKEFFGNDPKIASRNLPAEAVDKVQVFDKKSDQAVFTGIDDGDEEKAINLKLKENYRKSTFGSLTAGGGTDERFRGNGNVNRFNQGQQLSVLGMANNTNEQGFSISDYLNFTGGAQRAQGGRGGPVRIRTGAQEGGAGAAPPPLNTGQSAEGIMTSWAGGVNFHDSFNAGKLDAGGNYFLDHLDHETDQSMERISYLPEGDYRFLQDGRRQNDHTGHRGTGILEYRPDSANSFKLTGSFNYSRTRAQTENLSSTLAPGGDGVSSSSQTNFSEGDLWGLNADLLYRHRFGKPGRTFSANLLLGAGENGSEGELQALNELAGGAAETIRQVNSQSSGSGDYSVRLAYTEPLGASTYLEGSYRFSRRQDETDRSVWDTGDGSAVYNPDLSSRYNSTYGYQQAGLNFHFSGGAYNLTAGVGYQQSRLSGELLTEDAQISRDYQSFLPSLQFRYDLAGNRHLEFDYRTLLQEPSIEQLQPVIDNSDPLNLYMGNPELQPAYVQQAHLRYLAFSPPSMMHFFGSLNVGYTSDAISYSQTVDDQLVRTTQPVNAGDQLEIRGNADFGFPIRGINSRVGLMANASRETGISLLNGEESRTVQHTLSGELRYHYRYGEVLDLMLNGRLSREQNTFGSGGDQLFFNQRYGARLDLDFLDNYRFGIDFNYLIYSSKPGGFGQEIPLLDLSLSRYVFRDKSGEIGLSLDNLLDKDLGVSQEAGVNYLERSVIQSLGRYALLSFTYTLNKQLNPFNRRGGNMIRLKP